MGRKAKNRIKYDNIDSTPDENIDPEWQKKQDDMVKKEEEYNRQMGVLEIRRKMMDYIEESRKFIYILNFSGKCGSKVKTETIHVQLSNPIAKAIHNQFQHLRVIGI